MIKEQLMDNLLYSISSIIIVSIILCHPELDSGSVGLGEDRETITYTSHYFRDTESS